MVERTWGKATAICASRSFMIGASGRCSPVCNCGSHGSHTHTGTRRTARRSGRPTSSLVFSNPRRLSRRGIMARPALLSCRIAYLQYKRSSQSSGPCYGCGCPACCAILKWLVPDIMQSGSQGCPNGEHTCAGLHTTRRARTL